MAEAYKGLTIRLGADDTELKSALRLIIKYANQAQTEIRRLDKSLKFDTSNVNLLVAKMETLGEKALITAKKLSLMDKALKEAAAKSKAFDVTKASMESVYSDAEKALSAYNRVNDALATYKRKILEMNGIRTSTLTAKEVNEYISSLKKAGSLTDEQTLALKRLKQQHKITFDDNNIARERLALKELQSEYERTKVDIKAMAYEMRSVQDVLISNGATEGLRKVNAELKTSSEITKALEEDYKRLKHIIDTSPVGIEKLESIVSNTRQRIEQIESSVGSLRNKEANLIKDLEKIEEFNGFDKLSADLRETERWTKEAADNFEKIGAASVEADGKVKALVEQLDALKVASITKNVENDIRKLTSELKEAEANAGKLKEDLSYAEKEYTSAKTVSEIKKTKSEIETLEAKIASLNGSMGKMSSVSASMFWSLRSVGTALMSTVTPAAMMAASSIVNSAEEIDSAYRNMRKTVQGTEEQFEYLKSAALDFASTHYTSADQILEIEALGGQLGIVVDNLESFATVVSNLNIATNITDAEELATQIGKLSGVLEISSEDFDSWSESFGDALVRLGNNEPVLESDVMEIATRFGSMSKIIGMSTSELLAWSTTASATGVKAEAAGSSLIRFASDVETACSNGGSSLEGFAGVAGMASDQFAALFKDDPSKALQKIIVGLKGINDAGGSVNSTLEQLGITNVRDKQLLEGMVNTTSILSDSLTMSANAFNGVSDQWGKSGDAANEASKKCEGFSGTVQRLRNIAQELGSEVGESLTPFINVLANGVKMLTDAFKALPSPVKSVMTAFSLLTIATGPVLSIVGAGGQAVKNFSGTLKQSNTYINSALSVLQKYDQCLGITANDIRLNADHCKAYTNALDNLGDGVKQQITRQVAMNAALTAAKAAAVSLAAVGIALCISKVTEYIKSQQKFEKATDGLIKSVNKVIDKSSDIKGVKLDFSGLDEDIDGVIDNLAELSDSIEDTMDSASSGIAEVEKYGNAIINLNGSADPVNIAKLQIAVKGLNDTCGTNYEVDAETGSIMENGNAVVDLENKIKSLIETKKMQIKYEAYEDVYKKAYDEQAKALGVYTDALTRYNEALEQWKAAGGKDFGLLSKNVVEAENALRKAEESYNSLNGAVITAEENMTLYQLAVDNCSSPIYRMIADNELLKSNLLGLGYSLEDLYLLSTEQWMQLASAFENGTGDVSTIMSGFANDLGITSSTAMDNVASSVKNGEPAVTGSLTEMMHGVIEKAKEKAKESSEAGKNLGSGVSIGLDDSTPSVLTTVGNFAKKVLEKLKLGLGEHSPSKETYKYGVYFNKGFELGVSENTYGSVMASQNLALESIKAVQETLNNADYSEYFNLTDDINRAVWQMKSASPSFSKSAKVLGQSINSEISAGVGIAVSAGQESVVNAVNSVHDDLGNIIATYAPDSVNATRSYLYELARRAR